MPKRLTALIFTDGAPGNVKQARALAHGLGQDTQCVRVQMQRIDRWFAPRFRRARWPDLQLDPPVTTPQGTAIGCGRAGAVALDALKRAFPSIKTIQILDPKCDPKRFDMVICPEHDGLRAPNVLNTTGSLHEIDDLWLASGQQQAQAKAVQTFLLIGAPTRNADYSLDELVKCVRTMPAQGLCVSASRRTPDACLRLLRQILPPEARLWSGDTDGPNPYQAWLSSAANIIVTPDSVNMISEACATHAHVQVLFGESARGKIARFLTSIMPRLQQVGDGVVPLRPMAALIPALLARLNQDA